jgi:hypothetical protein
MSETAETLRHRIALYERYLREGASAELATTYLRSILADRAVLAQGEAEEKEHGG